jgi:hypothetical protein
MPQASGKFSQLTFSLNAPDVVASEERNDRWKKEFAICPSGVGGGECSSGNERGAAAWQACWRLPSLIKATAMNIEHIDFSGEVPEAVTIRQQSIDRESPHGGAFSATLVVSRQGLPEVSGTLRFNYDDYMNLRGAEDARRAAVRVKLVETLVGNWRNFRFLLVNENEAVRLLAD